jgi:hypothetical protein
MKDFRFSIPVIRRYQFLLVTELDKPTHNCHWKDMYKFPNSDIQYQYLFLDITIA